MPEAADMSGFLRRLADELRKLGSHRPPQDRERIYRQFRSRADLDAALEVCGNGAHRFEIEKDERQRREGTLSRYQTHLIHENILGANILVDGAALPGFFDWQPNGKAVLTRASPSRPLVLEHAIASASPQTAQIIDFPAVQARAEAALQPLTDHAENAAAEPDEMELGSIDHSPPTQNDAQQVREREALRNAITWARQGFAVFPLKVCEEAPLTVNGIHDATSDAGIVKQWWSEDYRGANIGIATGAKSGCVVLAIDASKGVTAREALAKLEKELGPLPLTLTVNTPEAGKHFFFSFEESGLIPVSARDWRPGVHIHGQDGYVVAVGSVDQNGGAYEFDDNDFGGDFPDLPEAWRREMTCIAASTEVGNQKTADTAIAEAEALLITTGVFDAVEDGKETGSAEAGPQTLDQIARDMIRANISQIEIFRHLAATFPAELEAKIGKWEVRRDGRLKVPHTGFVKWHVELQREEGRLPPLEDETAVTGANGKPAMSPANTAASAKKPARAASHTVDEKKIADDAVRSWLLHIRIEGVRERWLTLGRALNHHYNGSIAGKAIWAEWTEAQADSSLGLGDQLSAEWSAMEGRKAGAGNTISTIYNWAVAGLVAELNKTLALRLDSVNPEVFQRPSTTLKAVKLSKLKTQYANQKFPTIAKGKIDDGNPIDVWLNHPNRRDVSEVSAFSHTAEPFVEHQGQWYANVWGGYELEPKEDESCELFWQHVEDVICRGDRDLSAWVRKYVLWVLKHPTALPEVALVLKGKMGTGKNTFTDYLARAMGSRNTLHISKAKHLTGDFNQQLQGRALVVADEALFVGEHKDINQLKALLERPTINVEPKGVDSYQAKNIMTLLITSNEKTPVGITPDDRRFVVLEISEKYRSERAKGAAHAAIRKQYFAPLRKELEGDGPARLLWEALNTDLGDWEPRNNPPWTEAASEMAGLTMPPHYAWMMELADAGHIPLRVMSAKEQPKVKFAELWDWAVKQEPRLKNPGGKKSMTSALDEAGWRNDRSGGATRIIPPLREFRKWWLTKTGGAASFLENSKWEEEVWTWSAATAADKVEQLLATEIYEAM